MAFFDELSKEMLIVLSVILIVIMGVFLIFSSKSPIPTTTDSFLLGIPRDYYSGSSRFSQGSCEVDGDCFVAGCSSEVCSSNPDIVTTCEIRPDFPNKAVYECGCVKENCGWRKR